MQPLVDIALIPSILTALKLTSPLPLAFFTSLTLYVGVSLGVLVSYYTLQDKLIPSPLENTPYDFIIVGAGSAGAVVANRLSACGKFQVLLLEAGVEPTALNAIPALNFALANNPFSGWGYRSVPQKYCGLELINSSVPCPRGKVLGGSSVLNSMFYLRGNPKDYNNWAEIVGDKQWNYENLLPYFKKSQNYLGNFPDERFHGTGGPLTVSKQGYVRTLDFWLKAAKEAGYTVGEENDDLKQNFYPVDLTIKNGRRADVYSAFIEPILERRNLHLVKCAHVTKVNLDANGRASGVEFMRNGKKVTVLATREIVLSAGSFNTPKLLMLSGIGPSEHLKSVGITPKVVLPGVGLNLHDHPVYFVPITFDRNSTVSWILEEEVNLQSIISYLHGADSYLSKFGAGVGFVNTSFATKDWADIEFHQFPTGYRNSFINAFAAYIASKPGVVETMLKPIAERHGNNVLMMLGRPSSRGRLQLASSNPMDMPLIDQNIYSNSTDLDRMVEGFKAVVNLYEKTEAFKSLGAEVHHLSIPRCNNTAFRSDKYYKCFLRSFSTGLHHEVGTAKMGSTSDPLAVVDSKLK